MSVILTIVAVLLVPLIIVAAAEFVEVGANALLNELFGLYLHKPFELKSIFLGSTIQDFRASFGEFVNNETDEYLHCSPFERETFKKNPIHHMTFVCNPEPTDGKGLPPLLKTLAGENIHQFVASFLNDRLGCIQISFANNANAEAITRSLTAKYPYGRKTLLGQTWIWRKRVWGKGVDVMCLETRSKADGGIALVVASADYISAVRISKAHARSAESQERQKQINERRKLEELQSKRAIDDL